MAAFLVTGNPGSGKTTLAAELARRGLVAIDPDYDPELSYWEDDAGTQILKADGPAQPNEQGSGRSKEACEIDRRRRKEIFSGTIADSLRASGRQ